MKKLLFLFWISIVFNVAAQNTTREGVAFVISSVLYGDGYDYDSNPANNYPSPWIDLNTSTVNGQILNIISRLDYDDGITPFPFLEDGSANFHPTAFMPRAAAILAVVEAWNIPVYNNYNSPYNDIPDGYGLLPWINAAYNMGIIGGTNFFPLNPVQNNDIISWSIAAENSSFGNVNESVLNNSNNYFLPHFYTPENMGVFKGLEQGVFSHYAKNSFVIPDIQMSLNFSHFYSTTMVELPESFYPLQPLTRGWSHTYNIYAQRQYVDTDGDGDDEEIYYITWADGTIHVWNESESDWITEGVYSEANAVTISGVDNLMIWPKTHGQYRFAQLDDDREIFYLIKISDKNGNDIEIDYESADEDNIKRIEKVTSPSGKELVFDYFGNSDRLRQIVDPIDREINFTYSNGRLRDFTDAKGNETEYFYVTNNTDNNFERFLLNEIELPRGNRIEATYDDDKDGYLSSYKVNNNTPISYDIQVDYNTATPITVNMDVPMPDGSTDQHSAQYNSLGLLESFQSSTDDIVISYPSSNSSNPFLPTQVSSHNLDIEYDYDSNGNIERIDYENGDRVYEFDWNNENELLWSEDPRNNRTYYDYDGDHNLIKITDALSNDINLEYFSNGNLKKVTNQEGIAIDFTYHLDGPLETFTAPEGITGSFLYDDVNRLMSKTINGLTSSYSYDDNDNIETFTNSGSLTTVFSYDDNDNVASITNANSVTTVFTYNTKDQLESESYGALNTEYSYNDDDTLDEVEKPSGQTVQINYTNDGQYDGSGTVIDLQYDNNERVIRIESEDVEYQFQYDNLNQIDVVEVTGENRDVEYDYDSAGNIINVYYPNVGSDARVRYFYDAKNRLTRIRAINFNNLPNTNLVDYTYLDDDRISQMEYGNGFITTYTYDDAGRPTGVKHVINGEVYYDEVRTLNNRGNVLELKVGYNSTAPPLYEPTEEEQNFQYDDNNHVISAGYNVSDDGNTTTSPIGEFIYDIDDQPRQRIANGETSQYEYDAFGNRTRRIEGNNLDTEYLWDILGKNIIQEYNIGSNDPKNYAYGIGLEARIINGVAIYYHGDLRGNVVLTTDADGNRIQDYQYSPFGHTDRVNPGPNPDQNEFTFLGKQGIIEDDRDAGLYYIRARYYDATIGRFITEDPVASFNLYTYAKNNPLSFVDVNGENPLAIGVIIGVVAWDFFTDVNFAGDDEPALNDTLPWDILNTIGLPTKVAFSSAKIALKKSVKELPQQIHHFATNKHSYYTVRMSNIAKQFGLDLNGSWNKQLLPHQGRHPHEYHEFVLDGMERAAQEASGRLEIFLDLFNKYVKEPVINNPNLLRKSGWE